MSMYVCNNHSWGFNSFGLEGEQDLGPNKDNEELAVQDSFDLDFDPFLEVPQGGWLAMAAEHNKELVVGDESLIELDFLLQNMAQVRNKEERVKLYASHCPHLGSIKIFRNEKKVGNPAGFKSGNEVHGVLMRLGLTSFAERIFHGFKIWLEIGDGEYRLEKFLIKAPRSLGHDERMLFIFSRMMELLKTFNKIPPSCLRELDNLKRKIAKNPVEYLKPGSTEVYSKWMAAIQYFEDRKAEEVVKQLDLQTISNLSLDL